MWVTALIGLHKCHIRHLLYIWKASLTRNEQKKSRAVMTLLFLVVD